MRWFAAACVVLTAISSGAAQSNSYDPKFDEETLRRANIKADAKGLVQFFRVRTLSENQLEQLACVVDQLGDISYVQRIKAATEVLKYGNSIKPLLLKAIDGENLEVSRRAELCLRQIDDNNEAALSAAAARLLANGKTPSAIETLISFAPFATDTTVLQTIREALPPLIDPKKPPAVLLDALTDKIAARRALASEALIQSRTSPLPPLIFELLKDPATQVRLRTSLALLQTHDKRAVPVLIDLLPKLSAADVWQAEDALFQLAGDNAPKVHMGTATPPAQVQAAWQEWWRNCEVSIDMTRFSAAAQLMGLTLVTYNDVRGLTGRVMEMTRDKQKTWEITGLRYPVDAQVIGPDRVLVVEYLNRQVTERDFSGNILWQKQVLMPIHCQRLRNGDTFIATRRQLLIVDRDGTEKFIYNHNNTSIMAAERLRDGRMVVVSSGGILEILDAAGKAQKSFKVDPVYSMGSNIEVLADGRFLLPVLSKNLVAEYNADGDVVWTAPVISPTSVQRLPNGNTLVVSLSQQRVVELARDGTEVWSCTTDGRPWRARRR